MKHNILKKSAAIALSACISASAAAAYAGTETSSERDDGTYTNPFILSDVPDEDVIRVGDTYYMVSTTMHLSPGVPIMKSKDLVNWEIVNYVYDILGDSDANALRNGKQEYGRGQWAASVRYRDGIYYVTFVSNTLGKTYIFTTDDIENGQWTRHEIDGVNHDLGLFLDDDGKAYLVSGAGSIWLKELTDDATAVKEGGINKELYKTGDWGMGYAAEGSHMYKVDGRYYIFMIS